MNVRPATQPDLQRWFDGKVPCTMRAFVLEREGELLAVGGVALQPGWIEAFSKVAPTARAVPGIRMALGRLAVKVRALIQAIGGAFANQDPSEPTSPALLVWCGFREEDDGVWRHGC
jgi:hypothetical protein